ncbi:Na+/H+ antiporter subunit D [Staphylococcus condimenti]|uniref:Na+/H+ antiporter subunit D n=1 Tax=Staphylococcus condimenti TaxID=70255 RepID=A0A4Q7CL31_9STAP|nr:Na+/H+ antiporter subunit D [Staphylococcus condimenti]RZI01307.1 Na+/H+ antiporter subunit D [Staphylococcus condimenti]RZI04886.1 Na+/H+ antiporter subunit D [Staphylococcus condimenti]
MNNILLIPLLVPLVTGLVLFFFKERLMVTRRIAITMLVITTSVSVYLLVHVFNHQTLVINFGDWQPPFGIQFVGDTLGLIFTTIANFVVTVIIYFGFGKKEHLANRYFLPSFILFMLTGVNGSFLTADIFNLYVMFEIMLISSFVLLTLGQTVEQLRASVIYVVMNVVSSWFFLIGIAYLYGTLGTLNFGHLAMRIAESNQTPAMTMVAIIMIFVFGGKAALVMFMWLPKAYAALNTELAALFAGLMTKVGVYALIRVMTLLFDQQPDITHQLMYYMAVITMIIGAVGVLGYDDVKKIAAYQVILSIGFSVLGLSALNEAGVTGAIFYAGHDMIIKTLLFLVLGVFVVQCGSRSYKNMGGLIHVHPSLGIIFFILTLSIGGVPPFSGFPGKVLIIQGAMEKGYVTGVIVLVITSIIAMYSLLRIFFVMYFGQENVPQVKNTPLAMHKIVAMMLLTAATIFMGVCGEWFLDFARQAAEFNLHPSEYIKSVIPDVKVEVD